MFSESLRERTYIMKIIVLFYFSFNSMCCPTVCLWMSVWKYRGRERESEKKERMGSKRDLMLFL